MKTACAFLMAGIGLVVATEQCCADWGKCGGVKFDTCSGCCNSRYYCNKTSEYYSECVPKALVPFPPAPPTKICGVNGTKLDHSMLKQQGVVSSAEIAVIWAAATEGLTKGFAPGGNATCLAAVSIALGECGHPPQSNWMTAEDPVCSFTSSGPGGVWQVTSQDKHDTLLAGCSDGTDPCCNARLAYAHAYNQGGATVIPSNYCEKQADCTQLKSDCQGKTGPNWNSPSVDQKKPNATIPACSHKKNPWYPDGGKSLASVSIDQEPCYWGPFSVAAGGNGKEFFAGFYGWGGFLQHYLDSKAGQCDPSPQCENMCNETKWAKYPSYIELAQMACGQE